MKNSFYLVAAAMVLLASCSQPFKKAKEGGIQYKIISDGKGKKIEYGNFFELAFEQHYKGNGKDSLLFTSKDAGNQILPLDSMSLPPVYLSIFKEVRKGDSIVVKQLTDSIMKQGPGAPFMKKGAYMIANYKIVNIFTSRDEAEKAYQEQMKIAMAKDSIKSAEQLKKDDKAITEYLKKNNIQAVKAPAGTYVQILNPGEGDAIDTSKVVKVFYTGKPLDGGEVFDSNKDPKFGHPEALSVNMAAKPGDPRSVIKGWTDGISVLKKGAKANLYIPSSLAYGPRGRGKAIKENANLFFEVEISDVITQAQAEQEEAAERKKMEDNQKKIMDSLQKARKDTSAAGGKKK